MDFKFRPASSDSVELDVTSFMNLMIVLVPALLITLSFTQVSVLDIHLPELTGGTNVSGDSQSQLSVRIQEDGFKVYYPDDVLIQEVPLMETEEGPSLNYRQLSLVMQEVKNQLEDHRRILLLLEPDVDYQSLISTMDVVRSFRTVIVADVVEVELFPEISLGEAK